MDGATSSMTTDDGTLRISFFFLNLVYFSTLLPNFEEGDEEQIKKTLQEREMFDSKVEVEF